MLRKKEVYTIITPIPSFIPRQLAIDILHSHSEVITLNPLVLSHHAIPAPRNAASDEFYSTWYEIIERIQYIPGMGKMGSGRISFTGCFHDMPWGLQTHILAPMNIDLRNKYRIDGNQPGLEPPPERVEMGLTALGAPADGLYLREDIEIKCNITMVSFVKSQLKAASKEMVARIIKKAELLDSGVLQAMFENGKLKTFNPNDRSRLPPGSPSPSNADTEPSSSFAANRASVNHNASYRGSYQRPASLSLSPHQQNAQLSPSFAPMHMNYSSAPNTGSLPGSRPTTATSHGYHSAYIDPSNPNYGHAMHQRMGSSNHPAEIPGTTLASDGNYRNFASGHGGGFIAEMPGDTQQRQQTTAATNSTGGHMPPPEYSGPPLLSPGFQQSHHSNFGPGPGAGTYPQPYRVSAMSTLSSSAPGGNAPDTQRTSVSSEATSPGFPPPTSPPPSKELASHAETHEEHHANILNQLDPRMQVAPLAPKGPTKAQEASAATAQQPWNAQSYAT